MVALCAGAEAKLNEGVDTFFESDTNRVHMELII
jgi:hypothetical protein